MNLTIFEQLRSSTGALVLAAATELAPCEATFAAALERLQKRFDRELARAALQTVMWRRAGREKFTQAEAMFFLREALEQASGEIVARHRARRFAGWGPVGDFCCGIGGDTVALAEVERVIAVDRDPLRLAMAAANLEAYGCRLAVELVEGDLLTMPLPEVRAAFVDPARRQGERRFVSMQHYEPNPAALLARMPAGIPVGMKLAPAISWEELNRFDGEVEFISVGGELKEAVLWLGPLATKRRRASVLPAGVELVADEPAPSRPGPVSEYLYDPDPAVTRAGLVTDLGQLLDAHQIDADLAFLSGPRRVDTALARVYRVEEAFPFHLKRLRDWLRARNVGRVTILKRGSAIDAEMVRKQLKLDGEAHRILALTRVSGQPYAIVANIAT